MASNVNDKLANSQSIWHKIPILWIRWKERSKSSYKRKNVHHANSFALSCVDPPARRIFFRRGGSKRRCAMVGEGSIRWIELFKGRARTGAFYECPTQWRLCGLRVGYTCCVHALTYNGGGWRVAVCHCRRRYHVNVLIMKVNLFRGVIN